jgi:hypothetical protein
MSYLWIDAGAYDPTEASMERSFKFSDSARTKLLGELKRGRSRNRWLAEIEDAIGSYIDRKTREDRQTLTTNDFDDLKKVRKQAAVLVSLLEKLTPGAHTAFMRRRGTWLFQSLLSKAQEIERDVGVSINKLGAAPKGRPKNFILRDLVEDMVCVWEMATGKQLRISANKGNAEDFVKLVLYEAGLSKLKISVHTAVRQIVASRNKKFESARRR